MKKTLYGTLYLIVFSYVLVIASELSHGVFFSGIQKKLGFMPFVDILTEKNLSEIIQVINGTSLINSTTIKIVAVGILISLTFGFLISKYLVFPISNKIKN